MSPIKVSDTVFTVSGDSVIEHCVETVGRKWASFSKSYCNTRFDMATMLTEGRFGGGESRRVYATRAECEAAVADAIWTRANATRVQRRLQYISSQPASTWRRVDALLDEIDAEQKRGGK